MCASVKSLCHLPTEIIHAVARHAATKELLALSQTSRRIHAISLEIIYRHVALYDHAQAAKYCTAVASRPETAKLARKLKMMYLPLTALPAFDTRMKSVVRKMQNLHVLDIHSRFFFESISDLTLPRLSTCTLPISLDLGSFLGRNSTVTDLVILPAVEEPCSEFYTSPITPVHLPKLQRFVGPDLSACSFIPGSLASNITIFCTLNPNVGSSGGLEAIARSNADIIDFNCLIIWLEQAFLIDVAKYLPGIRSLQIAKPSETPAPEDEELFMVSIATLLRSLTCLETMSLLTPIHGPDEIADDELEAEFRSVQIWGEIAPRLQTVALPSNTLWTRVRDNIWFPSNRPTAEFREERHQWLIKKALSSPDLPREYQTLAEFVGNEAGIATLKAMLDSACS
ncbi:hypothetical protein B0H15DRAFT_856591 [Mycena belliarum]|uniref:F-box domain-containing protein n=1 Tax=Mycena belliarum TaxID=1033014 RepID=A0AAD6TZ82_9AGAR|nr:hypothetical protein B0H15DRAFT_856591 [Mycena belliae]